MRETRSLGASLVFTLIAFALGPVAQVESHEVDRVFARSICRYEERYYVWSPREPWRVWGRVEPSHRNLQVVLQKGQHPNYRKWKVTRTDSSGRYEFQGTAPTYRENWSINLRVFFRGGSQHGRVVSENMYIDMNPYARC